MSISTEGKIGIGLGLIGLLGAGVLVVAPEPWVKVTGWTMIIVAVVGLFLLAGHHVVGQLKRRNAEKRKAVAGPSKEELRELYDQIEAVKELLAADEIIYSKHPNVGWEAFHEVFAVMIRLAKLKVPIPLVPQYEKIVQFETFNAVMYRYLAIISPLLRDGELDVARSFAQKALDSIKAETTNPPAEPPQAPEPQDTPGRTSPQTFL